MQGAQLAGVPQQVVPRPIGGLLIAWVAGAGRRAEAHQKAVSGDGATCPGIAPVLVPVTSVPAGMVFEPVDAGLDVGVLSALGYASRRFARFGAAFGLQAATPSENGARCNSASAFAPLSW